LGLGSALSWYAEGFHERVGVRVQTQIDPNLGRLSPGLELVLFRITQEALSNIHRHSGSPTARITLSRSSAEVTLLIRDSGCGLPKEVAVPQVGVPHIGVGIAGMRERVRQFGGKLEIASTNSGTTVKVVLPVVAQAAVAEAQSAADAVA